MSEWWSFLTAKAIFLCLSFSSSAACASSFLTLSIFFFVRTCQLKENNSIWIEERDGLSSIQSVMFFRWKNQTICQKDMQLSLKMTLKLNILKVFGCKKQNAINTVLKQQTAYKKP